MVTLFLLWQLSLIGLTLDHLYRPFPLLLFDRLNESHPLIPKIIHQLWKTSDLSTYPIVTSHGRWQETFPDYKVRLWTDADLDRLISSGRYSYLLNTYRSYMYAIQRADLARLIVLHFEGGIYADLDVFPQQRAIESLRSSGASLIIPQSSLDSCLINHFLVAPPNSSLLDYILHRVPSTSYYRRIIVVPYLEVFSTGPILLTRVIREWLKNSARQANKLWILSSSEVNIYVGHSAGRSWHSFDVYIFNKIDSSPRLFACNIVCSVVLFLLLIRYRKNIRWVFA
jgi:inositol phosphorylceramide mannosyltransferase catalytic subunit